MGTQNNPLPEEKSMDKFVGLTKPATTLANITGQFNAIFPSNDGSTVRKRRSDFKTQEVEYVSDGKEFMITAIAEPRGRHCERRIALHLKGDITSGTYVFKKNDTSGPIIQLIYSEMDHINGQHFLMPLETIEGTLELEVSENHQYYKARHLNFTAISRNGLTLEIEADFEVWMAVVVFN